MTVSGVSPGDPDPIGAVAKSSQNKLRVHPGGARDPYDPDIGRVLEAAYAREISRTITTPVTEKSRNLWFPVIHFFIFPSAPLLVGVWLREEPRPRIGAWTLALNHDSLIMAIICPVSNPLRLIAPDLQEAIHSPHPLQSAGFTSAFPARGP